MLNRLILQSYPTNIRTLFRTGDDDWWDLDAPYQRSSVWTHAQQMGLIKSLYLKLPIPAIVYSDLADIREPGYVRPTKIYRVVDGKQRILTIRAFVNDEFAVPGDWFEMPTDWVVFSELLEVWRSELRERVLPFVEFNAAIVHPSTADGHRLRDANDQPVTIYRSAAEVLQAEAELYLLLNEGGTAHTAEDLAVAREFVVGVREGDDLDV